NHESVEPPSLSCRNAKATDRLPGSKVSLGSLLYRGDEGCERSIGNVDPCLHSLAVPVEFEADFITRLQTVENVSEGLVVLDRLAIQIRYQISRLHARLGRWTVVAHKAVDKDALNPLKLRLRKLPYF